MRILLAGLLALLAVPVMAADKDVGGRDIAGIAGRLAAQTGVQDRAPGVSTPDFVLDPAWPQPLPNRWIMGQVGGVFVDGQDRIWVLQNPRTLSNDETGLDGAVAGGAANGLGFARPNGPVADCCHAAPSVMAFDARGKLLQAWGGPADPGWLEQKCRPQQGCIWPSSEHGIYVDPKGNVWIGGSNPGRLPAEQIPWTTNRAGPDGFVLKFDSRGNFLMRIGGPAIGPSSNDKDSADGRPQLFRAADMVLDEKTNRLFIADGYGNRRVLIVDADSGKYLGHFGAYGNNPVDEKAADAAGRWLEDAARGNTRPAFFRTPVHCVKLARDGKLYVCDRGNDRIQVFDSRDPALGQPCGNPGGEAGRCGYVAEQSIRPKTDTMPVLPGTAVAVGFSTDAGQSCLYVGDNSNMTVHVLDRASLRELGRLGRSGMAPGQFHWLHQLAVDGSGNLYTGEVDAGKRAQKFLRYGAAGCRATVVDGVVK